MKTLLVSFIFLLVGTTSVYSQSLERSPDTTVKPVLLCGQQSDNTITPISVTSAGKVEVAT